MVKRYIVYGNVQGVGFRYFIYSLALKLKFNGSVKNLIDGSVEVLVDSDIQEKILSEIKKGNFFSYVDRIEEVEVKIIEKKFTKFNILY